MRPPSLWSGNLRLSLVLIPVRLVPAVSTEEAISFRQIHEQAVALAAELIERESGRFEPERMPDEFAAAVHEMIQAKIERRAPQIAIAQEGKPTPEVINIMAALKESMEAKGRGKVRDAVRRRMGKSPKEEAKPASSRARPSPRRTAH